MEDRNVIAGRITLWRTG